MQAPHKGRHLQNPKLGQGTLQNMLLPFIYIKMVVRILPSIYTWNIDQREDIRNKEKIALGLHRGPTPPDSTYVLQRVLFSPQRGHSTTEAPEGTSMVEPQRPQVVVLGPDTSGSLCSGVPGRLAVPVKDEGSGIIGA